MQPEEGRHVLQYAARPASPPPTLCARARAEDTDKCKNFSQLIQKKPEKCSSSKNFAKRCRASCHAKYPTMNYCVEAEEALFTQKQLDAAVAAAKEAVCEAVVDIATDFTAQANWEAGTCDMSNVVQSAKQSGCDAAVLGLADHSNALSWACGA